MSFPKYDRYKESGVEWLGEVPNHWEVKPIKSISTCNDDVLDERTPSEYEIEYVEISGVDADRGILETTIVPFGDAPSRARRCVKNGDVIVSTVRTYLRAIAKVTDPPINMVASTGFAVVRPRAIEALFLGYLFRAEFLIARIIARSVGVSYPAINASELMRLDVPLPPLPEQRSIAIFLDRETAKIDELITEQQRLIDLLKEKRQAVISHAVTKGLNPEAPMKETAIEWLGEVPEHWDVVRIKYVLKSLEQGWSPQCENFPAEDGGWGVLKVGCVNGGTFNSDENKALPPSLDPIPELAICVGDVLISRANTRDLVGSAAVALADYPNLILCDKLYRLRLIIELCDPEFLVLYLRTPQARSQLELAASGASSSMLNIGQATVLEMFMPLPGIEEQIQITSYVGSEASKFQDLIFEAQHAIALLQERRTALISAAVTGKIDVRKVC
jgi:type I restriction enzyme, S subunit